MDVAGRTAVVTGGASGIGLATARALADRGARIRLVDVEGDALDDAVGFQQEGRVTRGGGEHGTVVAGADQDVRPERQAAAEHGHEFLLPDVGEQRRRLRAGFSAAAAGVASSCGLGHGGGWPGWFG